MSQCSFCAAKNWKLLPLKHVGLTGDWWVNYRTGNVYIWIPIHTKSFLNNPINKDVYTLAKTHPCVCVIVGLFYLLCDCCCPGVFVHWSHIVQTGSHTTAGPQSLHTNQNHISSEHACQKFSPETGLQLIRFYTSFQVWGCRSWLTSVNEWPAVVPVVMDTVFRLLLYQCCDTTLFCYYFVTVSCVFLWYWSDRCAGYHYTKFNIYTVNTDCSRKMTTSALTGNKKWRWKVKEQLNLIYY